MATIYNNSVVFGTKTGHWNKSDNSSFSNFSQIQTTMKMKEVTDICHTDVRYKALKTAGERKQALAEYQVHIRCC